MIGQKLGSFTIEAELGAGAMGVVYRGVRDSGKTRVAAVKVIALDQMTKGKGFERFIREAEILEQFRHPNIVRYLARGKQGKIFYYAMEYIEGPTLDLVLEDRGPLPWVDAATFAVQICDALHYAHEHSVVHRDLKPSNLMLSPGGSLKLTDFGIAKDLDATALTATGRTLGTAAYMAPEQIRGTPGVSHKTDLYALGVLLYQMLTGELPFQGGSAVVLMHLHMSETPPRASAKTEVIPVELDELVANLMAKAPADRPWDAAAVAMVLRSLLDRHQAKQPITMVWPDKASLAHNPTRAMDGLAAPKRKATKKKATAVDRLRAAAPVAGLLVALIAVGAAIGYAVYPPSAAYLYRQAEPLMASTERTDWLRAESDYLDELDRRFPGHSYKTQTDAWRDKIALSSAERRGAVLEKAAVPGFSKADTQGEQLYAAVAPEAHAASERGDDLDAIRRYREMAAALEKEPVRADRGWLLLARSRADALESAIRDRAKTVAGLIAQANAAESIGHPDQAVALRRDVLKRYGKFTDLAETLDTLRKVTPPEPTALQGPPPASSP